MNLTSNETDILRGLVTLRIHNYKEDLARLEERAKRLEAPARYVVDLLILATERKIQRYQSLRNKLATY